MAMSMQLFQLDNVREEPNDIKTVIDLRKYHEHKWTICVDLKMVNFLLGQERAFTKYPCYLCIGTAELEKSTGIRRSGPYVKL